MKRDNLIVAVCGVIFLFSLIMLFGHGDQGIKTTGYVTEIGTTSNVTITTYFSISMSGNLSQGIQFGNVSALPATNVNGTVNYNGTNTTVDTEGYNKGTAYWLNVSSDSNTAIDFCIIADALNTSTGDEIGLGNETYFNSTSTNSTNPARASEVSITTSYVKSGTNIAIGTPDYYRFWLDVPAGTPAGTYNNTVSFKGVTTGGAC
jgi:hypothetical protein